MNGADCFINTLKNRGVKYIFGVPGDEATLFDSLRRSGIEFITTRHGQAAVFMADVYGRLKGEASVCFSTLGPGATNLATGLANALLDRSPVVAISAQLASHEIHDDAHQYVDLVNFFKPITKWNAIIPEAADIPQTVDDAFSRAEAERPGPTHVTFPKDVIETEVPGNRACLLRPRPTESARAAQMSPPSEKLLDKVLEMIHRCKSAILFVGNAVIRGEATKELASLAEKLQVPVVVTYSGKGAISEAHPLFLGVASRYGKDGVQRAFDAADLVIALGYDFAEGIKTSRWSDRQKKVVVNIDTVTNAIGDIYKPDIEIVEDLKQCLVYLDRNIPRRMKKTSLHIQRLKRAAEDEFHEGVDMSVFPLVPQRIVKEIREVLAPEDILISDVGLHKQYVGLLYRTFQPKTLFFSNGLSCVGFGLPGSIGAKLAAPSRRVVCICGDGGFLMNVQELETAVRLKLSLTVIVVKDYSYGLMKRAQIKKYKQAYGVDFNNPDLTKLAESFGAKGYRVKSADNLKDILRTATSSDTVSVVDTEVSYDYENLL